jgi:hypothetical protein
MKLLGFGSQRGQAFGKNVDLSDQGGGGCLVAVGEQQTGRMPRKIFSVC